MSDILRKIEKLQKLDKEREKLMNRLMRSVIIKEIYPEAFEHGGVKTYINGNPDNFIFVIERGDNTKKEWPVTDVPKALVYSSLEKIRDYYSSQGHMGAVFKINKLLEKL